MLASEPLARSIVNILDQSLSRRLSHREVAYILAFAKRYVQLVSYICKHPILFTVQVLGGVSLIASLLTVPILGAVGFSSVGPVAGSAAAAWQASIGIVEAGSLFAFFQSVAMGGAALGSVITVGALGGVAVAALVIHEVVGRAADLGKVVGVKAGEAIAAVAPVVHEAGKRITDLGNIVKDRWCALWD